jgi:predicted pyridoxine 5'-phosphate oxidase superfamily flavin-nucleotide-binding protein
MLSKTEWWEVIATYNESIYPLQWVGLLVLISITLYLMYGKEEKANLIIKASLFIMNAFIGIRFFFTSEGFPLPLRISQGMLFVSIALLIGLDLKMNKLQFQFPRNGWKKILFIIGMVVMMIYPFVGGLSGKEMSYWIVPGTLPCPTTAYALLLFITAKKRENRLLFLLLLIWAIPFPPLVQLPKYQVYEDSIMFLLGLIALPLFIWDVAMKIRSMKSSNSDINLKVHKTIFEIKKDAVFATSSNDGDVNIVPIHSKHLLSSDKVLISDQFMNKSKKNVEANPYGTLSIMDNDKLYTMKGKCMYKSSGFLYSMAVKGAKKYAKKNAKNKNIEINCKGIIVMKVREFSVEDL